MFRSILAHLIIKSQSVFTTVLEVAGIGLVVYGIGRVSVTAGWIAAGCGLVLIGVLAA